MGFVKSLGNKAGSLFGPPILGSEMLLPGRSTAYPGKSLSKVME